MLPVKKYVYINYLITNCFGVRLSSENVYFMSAYITSLMSMNAIKLAQCVDEVILTSEFFTCFQLIQIIFFDCFFLLFFHFEDIKLEDQSKCRDNFDKEIFSTYCVRMECFWYSLFLCSVHSKSVYAQASL